PPSTSTTRPWSRSRRATTTPTPTAIGSSSRRWPARSSPIKPCITGCSTSRPRAQGPPMSDHPFHLSRLLERAAARRPARPAGEDEGGRVLSFAELDRQADRVATRLGRWGVGPGDRVGLLLPKGLEAVAAIHGILRAGAAYVPADASGPIARAAGVLADGRV